MRDRLCLLTLGFEDPAYPGRRFYCWHCALLDGVLASCPRLREAVAVHRIDWPRPRREIADLLGEENQSLPVLILSNDAPDHPDCRVAKDLRFIADKDAILRYLAGRYPIPESHP